MNKLNELKSGDIFTIGNLSTKYVVVENNSDKVTYRHLITDYPNKHHITDNGNRRVNVATQ